MDDITQRKYVIAHLIDNIPVDEISSVIEYYINNPPTKGDDGSIRETMDRYAWSYISDQMMVTDKNSETGIETVGCIVPVINVDSGYKLMIRHTVDDDSTATIKYELRDAFHSEKQTMAGHISKKFIMPGTDTFAPIIGFMSPRGSSPDMVLRTKNTDSSLSETGIMCGSMTHANVLKRLNLFPPTVLNRQSAGVDDTVTSYIKFKALTDSAVIDDLRVNGIFKNADNITYRDIYEKMDTPVLATNTGSDDMVRTVYNIHTQPHLCVILEMILRYNEEKHGDMGRWFFPTASAAINKSMI